MDFSKTGECQSCGRFTELNEYSFCEECEKEYEADEACGGCKINQSHQEY